MILAKFIWHSENSRTEFARNIDKLFGVPKREIEIIKEEQEDGEALNHTCEDCINGCDDEDSDSTHDRMPDLVEAENKLDEDEEVKTEDKDKDESEESDDVSIEHVNAEDLEIIKETLGFIKKTKEMLFEIKNDLEKKID